MNKPDARWTDAARASSGVTLQHAAPAPHRRVHLHILARWEARVVVERPELLQTIEAAVLKVLKCQIGANARGEHSSGQLLHVCPYPGSTPAGAPQAAWHTLVCKAH